MLWVWLPIWSRPIMLHMPLIFSWSAPQVTCSFVLPSLSLPLWIICFFHRYCYHISSLSSIFWEWSLLWSYSISFSPHIHFWFGATRFWFVGRIEFSCCVLLFWIVNLPFYLSLRNSNWADLLSHDSKFLIMLSLQFDETMKWTVAEFGLCGWQTPIFCTHAWEKNELPSSCWILEDKSWWGGWVLLNLKA